MRSRYAFVESEGIYFLTATIVEWLPVFTEPDAFRIITDSLAFCRKHKGLRLYADVIHENPVRRGYVDAPEHWRYSPARNYILRGS